jgi:type III secretion protein O
MNVYGELLSIKAFRENKADVAVHRQRGVLAEALAGCESALNALNGFLEYARLHEDALYRDLCSRIVRLREIENVQLAVVDLRAGEHQRQSLLEAAERQRDQEVALLEERKQQRTHATRQKEKFVELAQVHASELVAALERKEDAEMEEASEVRRDRAEWDTGDDDA